MTTSMLTIEASFSSRSILFARLSDQKLPTVIIGLICGFHEDSWGKIPQIKPLWTNSGLLSCFSTRPSQKLDHAISCRDWCGVVTAIQSGAEPRMSKIRMTALTESRDYRLIGFIISQMNFFNNHEEILNELIKNTSELVQPHFQQVLQLIQIHSPPICNHQYLSLNNAIHRLNASSEILNILKTVPMNSICGCPQPHVSAGYTHHSSRGYEDRATYGKSQYSRSVFLLMGRLS